MGTCKPVAVVVRCASLALCFAASATATAQIYSNAPVTNGVNSMGTPISRMAPQATLFDFGCQSSANTRLADDFVVMGAGWLVSRVSVFGYQTSTQNFSFTSATIRISTGGDPNSGVIILDRVGIPVYNGGFVGYRVDNLNIDITSRRIYRVDVPLLPFGLLPGRYSIQWSLAGSSGAGPFSPRSAPYVAGNAWQSIDGGTFAPVSDPGYGTVAEFPFEIDHGIPEPTTILALAIGVIAFTKRRTR